MLSSVGFDENGNCLDNAIIKSNDILEDILIAVFDMDRMRAYGEQKTKETGYANNKDITAVAGTQSPQRLFSFSTALFTLSCPL